MVQPASFWLNCTSNLSDLFYTKKKTSFIQTEEIQRHSVYHIRGDLLNIKVARHGRKSGPINKNFKWFIAFFLSSFNTIRDEAKPSLNVFISFFLAHIFMYKIYIQPPLTPPQLFLFISSQPMYF